MTQILEAIELLSKPTKKNVGLALYLLKSIPHENTGSCQPCTFRIFRYEEKSPLVKLKKFICAICPNCGSYTFDLNTETMTGSCLSCAFISKDYKADKRKTLKQSI